MLERVLFPINTHGTPIRKLSGGEKRRLVFIEYFDVCSKCAVLDEPTNDLDTQTLTVLEDYFESFARVVVTVSMIVISSIKHVTICLYFKKKYDIDFYYGSYSDFLRRETGRSCHRGKADTAVQKRLKRKRKN